MRSIRRYLDRQKCREAFFKDQEFESEIKLIVKQIIKSLKSNACKAANKLKEIDSIIHDKLDEYMEKAIKYVWKNAPAGLHKLVDWLSNA